MILRSIRRGAPGARFTPLYGCALLAWLLSGAVAMAAPVDDALGRPALLTEHAVHSTILGIATTGKRIVAVGERGIILLSEDDGRNWSQVVAPVSVTLTSVQFADSLNGVAVGHGGTVLATTDGGLSWQARLDGREAAHKVLAAAQSAGDPRALKIAEQFVADGPDKPFLDVAYLDDRKVIAVGAYGLAFISEDAGLTWSPCDERVKNPQGLHLYAVRVRNSEVLIAGEQGLILRSYDGGGTFQNISAPYKGSFFTAEILPDRSVIVAGLKGNTWHGSANGSQWEKVTTGQPVSITASQITKAGSILFGNQAGEILQLVGHEAKKLSTPTLPSVSGILTKADGSMLLATVNGVVQVPEVVLSSNNGASQ